ncbi:Uncharacterized protein FWK35_00019100 [Aphis craccivora]|uniref:Uncharacterized protein n=1 Tax=Aphis craccivora TaxID=307492 RepID=A0A6G0Y5D5_APHCR|nr:Uncharacterized protein FWK35_00019100 [Aphis craccivora]
MSVVRPMNLQQVEQLIEYLKTDFNLDKSVTLEEVVVKVKGIHNELISKHVPKNKLSFINQIKLLATEQLAKIDENYGRKISSHHHLRRVLYLRHTNNQRIR